MGKLGDLWVRLGLKSDDYKKGIDKAKKETKGFGSTLANMKAGALAVWAVIGTAATKMATDFIAATNAIGDAWGKKMGAMKAAYQSFLADAASGWKALLKTGAFFLTGGGTGIGKDVVDFWRNTFGNAKEAAKAGAEMTAAFDAEFELVNSIRLQREQISGELNELYVKMRDTTLAPGVRKAASERYKALLQPLADAEIAVYSNMMEAASKAWQAGSNGLLSREYSTAEMTDFFANYGTNPEAMKAKYPELQAVYETRKGDAQNSVIFDTATKLAAATNEMSRVDKEMGKVTLSINKQLAEQQGALVTLMSTLETELNDVLDEDIEEAVSAIEDAFNDMELEVPAINTKALDRSIKEVLAAADFYAQQLDIAKMKNEALEDAILGSLQGSMQGFTDMIFGLEGANMNNVLAALLSPFADLATRLGVIIITTGKGIEAFKVSLKSLQPGVALAAGAGLIALGAAMKSGIQALANQGGNTGGSAMSYGGSSGGAAAMNYESTLTVEVVGKISGNDIVLSGKKTNDKNSR
jgi:hypothetical protein